MNDIIQEILMHSVKLVCKFIGSSEQDNRFLNVKALVEICRILNQTEQKTVQSTVMENVFCYLNEGLQQQNVVCGLLHRKNILSKISH